MNSFFMSSLELAVEEGSSPSLPSDAMAACAGAEKMPQESFTPIADQHGKMDRRTFFHTDGRSLAYNPAASDHRKFADSSKRHAVGTNVELMVEEVHFGNPRVRIRESTPAPMPEMLKWPSERFGEYVLDCAEIDFGEYRVWSAVGIPSNRLLYAMKRQNILKLKACVVAPPVPDDADDVELTYGASVQAIQLVP
jgi:hypothetical protein